MCPHKDLKIVPARLRHKTGKFFAASMIESVVYDSQFTDILGRKTKRFSEALFSAVWASPVQFQTYFQRHHHFSFCGCTFL